MSDDEIRTSKRIRQIPPEFGTGLTIHTLTRLPTANPTAPILHISTPVLPTQPRLNPVRLNKTTVEDEINLEPSEIVDDETEELSTNEDTSPADEIPILINQTPDPEPRIIIPRPY